MNYAHYLNKAKVMAEISDYHRQHVGCVIVYKNRIISAACNTNKTHPIQRKYNRYRFDINDGYSPDSLHAEMHAMIQISKMKIDFSKVTVFVFRKLKARESGLARPCKSCIGYMQKLGIKTVVYSTDTGYAVEKVHK